MRFWIDKEQEKKPNNEWKDAYVFSINRKKYSTIFTNITDSWYRMDQMQIPAIYEDLFIIGLSIFAYYVSGNVLEPIGRDYLYSELVNPIFTKDGDNVKVKVAVKFLDNQTKATQVSQYELVLHKDSNWKIVG